MLGNLDRRFGAVAAANAGDMNPQRFEFANHRRGDGILPAEDGDLADRGPAQVVAQGPTELFGFGEEKWLFIVRGDTPPPKVSTNAWVPDPPASS